MKTKQNGFKCRNCGIITDQLFDLNEGGLCIKCAYLVFYKSMMQYSLERLKEFFGFLKDYLRLKVSKTSKFNIEELNRMNENKLRLQHEKEMEKDKEVD